MAREGRTKVIYKGTFVSNQSLAEVLLLPMYLLNPITTCRLFELPGTLTKSYL